MDAQDVLKQLRAQGNPNAVAGMNRFGIQGKEIYGISMPALRKIAKEIGKDHQLAANLWASGVHEARILATLVDMPRSVTEAQMEQWVKDFDSWDVCDQCCMNLFRKTPFAQAKVAEWSGREEEFVKRAGFALIATLAVHDKKADDTQFEQWLPLIKRQATDERNFVKKAVNWALRQIGKRNLVLNAAAIQAATEIEAIDSKIARWIAKDALRELTGEKVQQRLKEKAQK